MGYLILLLVFAAAGVAAACHACCQVAHAAPEEDDEAGGILCYGSPNTYILYLKCILDIPIGNCLWLGGNRDRKNCFSCHEIDRTICKK